MAIDIVQLEQALARQHASMPFSGVILVREQGQTVLQQSYGLANRSDSLPNTIDTRFAVASGAKTFASVAICQLVDQGLLRFDTLLKDCLDISFPYFDPAITVHHLLSHSSGIPDYFDESVMDDFEVLWKERPMYQIRKPSDFLPMFQNEQMKFAPGARFVYNNAAYIILGLIVEQISKLPFNEYVQANIFTPCNMTGSGYFAMDHLPPQTAYGYIEEANGNWRTNIYAVPIIGGPDGGVFTTAPDTVKFWDALMSNQLLSTETTAAMVRVQSATQKYHYGYGMWLGVQQGTVTSYTMHGQDPGVAFNSSFYPAANIQATILGNTVDATWPMAACLATAVETA